MTNPTSLAAGPTPLAAQPTLLATGLPPRAPDDAANCPWCARPALKDAGCNHVVCGRDYAGAFHVGLGCGRQWCFLCGGRHCGIVHDDTTGARVGASESHDATCCAAAAADPSTWTGAGWCPGGHNSHAAPREMLRPP